MTTLDRLLEIGVRCPCGKRLILSQYSDTPGMSWGLYCENGCEASVGPEDPIPMIDRITAWYVLTGGPISKEVPPPNGERVLCEYATTDEWATKWRISRITEGTAFSDGRRRDGYVRWFFIDRTPAIIRSWLESEVTTDRYK